MVFVRHMIVRCVKAGIPLLFVLFSLSVAAGAQGGKFTASVDRTTVAVGEQFQLTFTLEGTTSPEKFQPPSLDDFAVLTGPNASTNMQIINGSVSSSITYNYILQARKEGKFTIGPATAVISPRSYSTQPLAITVTKGSPQAKGQGAQSGTGDISKVIGDNIFLKVIVDRSRVYQGEQITATYKLYTRVGVANYNVTRLPSLSGFWNEDLDVPKQAQGSTEVVNGKQYRTVTLKKSALFPLHSGTLQIDPMEMTIVVQVQSRRRSNDIFDQFFNDPFFNDPFFGGVTNVNYTVRSEPVRITVEPLPPNPPGGFSGGVGKFTVESWLDKRQVKTNDPATLRVKISGRGNLKLLTAPEVVFPPDLEKYDPKISDNISNEGNQVSGSRTFEYLVIPRHAGEQKIASFPFVYFDPERKSYITSKSPEFVLNVEKGNDIALGTASGVSREDIKLLGEDIRFIKSGPLTMSRRGESFVGSVPFVAATAFPVAAFIGFAFYLRKRERTRGNVLLLRNRKARRMAQRRLKDAKQFLGKKQSEAFYTEVSRALWGYVGDKLGIAPADLTVDGIRGELQSRGVPEESVGKLASTIERCEFARFAPGVESGQMDGMYKAAVDLISTIEDHIG